jgi:hypothetical protein
MVGSATCRRGRRQASRERTFPGSLPAPNLKPKPPYLTDGQHTQLGSVYTLGSASLLWHARALIDPWP